MIPPAPQIVSLVLIRQLSASKPWHPSQPLGEQKSLCMLSFWGWVCCPVLVFLESVYFLSGFELCCSFWISTALCFCLLSPGSLQFLMSWASDALTWDTHPPFLFFFFDSQECVCYDQLTTQAGGHNPLWIPQRNQCVKEKDRGLNIYISYLVILDC